MSLLRQWPSWVALLGASLTTTSFAADAQPAPARAVSPYRAAAPARALPVDAVVVGGVIDPNIRNLEAQFRPQFEQMFYVELAFLRRTCSIDAKAFAEVAKAAKAHLHVAVREYAIAQNAMMRGGIGIRRVSDTIDPHSQMERLLAPLVESKLGPEQAQRYRQACDNRAASRKRAIVLNIIATMDDRLVLTSEQRDKLIQSLSSDYQHDWEQWMQMIAFNGAQYLPDIPDRPVVSLLSDRQRTVWRQMPKVRFGFVGLRIGVRGMGMGGEPAEIQDIAHIVEEVQDD